MSHAIVLMIAAVLVSFALACQTYSAWRINANNRRHDEMARADRNLFVQFATETLATIRAERAARIAEAESHRRAITQSCRYPNPPQA
jgi:flagellar basal body-associated protein FliL